jgi:hypothetical protein
MHGESTTFAGTKPNDRPYAPTCTIGEVISRRN